MDIFKTLCTSWHLSHPWTLQDHSSLTQKQKIISLAVLVAGLPFAIIGGVCGFYLTTSYFKNKQPQKLGAESLSGTTQSTHIVAIEKLDINAEEQAQFIQELQKPSDTTDLEVFVIGSCGNPEQQLPKFALDAAGKGLKVKVYNIDPDFVHRKGVTTEEDNLQLLYFSCAFPSAPQSTVSDALRNHLLNRVEKGGLQAVCMWTCTAGTKSHEFFKVYEDFASAGYRPGMRFIHQYEDYPALVYGQNTPDTAAIVGTTRSPDRPTPGTLYAKWRNENHDEKWLENHRNEYKKLDVAMFSSLTELSYDALVMS